MQHRATEARTVVRQLFDASEVDQVMASMDAEVSAEATLQRSSILAVFRQPVSRAQLHVGVTLQVLVPPSPCKTVHITVQAGSCRHRPASRSLSRFRFLTSICAFLSLVYPCFAKTRHASVL